MQECYVLPTSLFLGILWNFLRFILHVTIPKISNSFCSGALLNQILFAKGRCNESFMIITMQFCA